MPLRDLKHHPFIAHHYFHQINVWMRSLQDLTSWHRPVGKSYIASPYVWKTSPKRRFSTILLV